MKCFFWQQINKISCWKSSQKNKTFSVFKKISSLTFLNFLVRERVKTPPCASLNKVGEGREESKAKGQYTCGQPKINCFTNATIPLSDLPKVLPCLHYKLDQLPFVGCMVVNAVPSLWPRWGIQEGNKRINWVFPRGSHSSDVGYLVAIRFSAGLRADFHSYFI